jgi:integrase
LSKKRSESTLDNYRSVIRSFLRFTVDKNLNEYNAEELEEYFTYKLSSCVAYTVNLHRRCLMTIFNTAVKWKYINRNPVTETENIELSEIDFKFFTKEQFNKLIETVSSYDTNGMINKYDMEHWRQYYKDLFTFAVLSGLRFSELANLRPDDVDLNKNLIRVISNSTHKTKTKKTRFVELHPKLIPIYRRYSDREYLFLSFEGKKIFADRVTKQLHKFNKKAGNPVRDFKSFRSTFGMWLIEGGASLEYVSAQLGHSSITTTEKHYAKYITREFKGEINRINI